MSGEQEEPRDGVLAELAKLPTHDVDSWRAGRIRARAHEALGRTRSPGLERFQRIYDRVLEPAGVAIISVLYLGWAISAVLAVYGL